MEVLEEMGGVLDYKLPLKATLEISIKLLNQSETKPSEAKQLLNLCACLAPENIPPTLFRNHVKLLIQPLAKELSNKLKSNKLWEELTRYSLLEKQEDGNGYFMHQLLQEVVRDSFKGDLQYFQCVLDLLYNSHYFEYGNMDSHKQFIRLVPHVEAFFQVASDQLTENEEQGKIAHLYNESGIGNIHLGNYDDARKCLQNSLAIRETVLGKEHPDTAATYNNIALVYDSQGEYTQALCWCKKVLSISEKRLGADHPYTQVVKQNMELIAKQNPND